MEIGTQELWLDAGRVVKHFHKDVLFEAFKHRRLTEIGLNRGFHVPELLMLDEQASTLTYRFIENLTSSRQPYFQYVLVGKNTSRDAWYEHLFVRIGRTLAAIHRDLDVESRTEWQAPQPFEQVVRAFTGQEALELLSATPHALLHGDFGFSNVCTAGIDSQRLHIIDPSPNYYSSFSCNEYASIYLDIGKFSLCLRGLMPVGKFLRRSHLRASRLRKLFLQGYAEESGVNIQEEILVVVERALLTCKIRREMRTSLARNAAGMALFGLKDGRVIGKIANAK